MKTEQELIDEFLAARQIYEDSQKTMETFFRDKIREPLTQAKTIEDFEAIKWMVAPMPECVSKTLIFRTIILTEDRVIKSLE